MVAQHVAHNSFVKLRYSNCTDVGQRREENQDSHAIFDVGKDTLFVVADGMGGVRGGAVASQLAIKIFKEYVTGRDSLTVKDLVDASVEANTAIFEHGVENPELAGMGTTIVGLCFYRYELIVFNVGDSRAYRYRNGKLVQLTEDHTLVAELVKSGAITPDQVENHPVSHMLTRSLGPTPSIEVDCAPTQSNPMNGDRYFICSDGLYNMVSDEEIKEILQNSKIEDAASNLVARANENGGSDNITCIVVEFDGAAKGNETVGGIEIGDSEFEELAEVAKNFLQPVDNTTIEDNDTEEMSQDLYEEDNQDSLGQDSLGQDSLGQDSLDQEIPENDEIPTEDVKANVMSDTVSRPIDMETTISGPMFGDEVVNETKDTNHQMLTNKVMISLTCLFLTICVYLVIANDLGRDVKEYASNFLEEDLEMPKAFPQVQNNGQRTSRTALSQFKPTVQSTAAVDATKIVAQVTTQSQTTAPANVEVPAVETEMASVIKNSEEAKPISGDGLQSLPDDVKSDDIRQSQIEGNTAEVKVNDGSEKIFKSEMDYEGLIYHQTAEKNYMIRLSKDIDALQEDIALQKRRLELLDMPLTGEVMEMMKDNKKELRKLNEDLNSLNEKKRKYEKKNVRWFERSRNYENNKNVLAMADEIAPSVAEVHTSYDQLLQASMLYRKYEEQFSDEPDNEELKRQVSLLRREYNVKFQELRRIVEDVISKHCKNVPEHLAKIQKKLDNLYQKKAELEESIVFLQALISGDQKQKSVVRDEMETKIRALYQRKRELEEELAFKK